MDQNLMVHPVIAQIRASLISEGHSLFEMYEAEIERLTDGLIDASTFRQQTIEWASHNLRDIEDALRSYTSGTFRSRLAEVEAFGKIREFAQCNGKLDELIRQNTAMFSLEIDGGRYTVADFRDVSAAEAISTQKRVFFDSGYEIKNRRGYSFFEYGKKKGVVSPFRIYFSPFNLKKLVSTMAANLVIRAIPERELIIVPADCLFPCLFHYQYLNAELIKIYRLNTAKLLEDRIRLHIRLLELLMNHLYQFVDHEVH